MPLFKRRDGELVRATTLVRRMMPYIMPGRNESVVYFEQLVDLTRTLPFIEAWNARHERRVTLFHLVLAALGRGFRARPGLNRFVSGGHIYQRNAVELSFAVKRAFEDYAPLVTVKLEAGRDEDLPAFVERLHGEVAGGRGDQVKPVDTELKWLLRLPGFLLAGLMKVVRWLDRINLMPYAMTRHDPMYASAFVANLGSIGIDRVFHHLYEYGTVSIFCAIGTVSNQVVADESGQPAVRPMVRLRFSFDERINDGHYCAAALTIVKDLVEHPERFADAEYLASLEAGRSGDEARAKAALAGEKQRVG